MHKYSNVQVRRRTTGPTVIKLLEDFDTIFYNINQYLQLKTISFLGLEKNLTIVDCN